MAVVQDLPLQLPMAHSPRAAACHLLMLLGASVLVFSVVGEPPSIHGAVAGLLLWVVAVARLLTTDCSRFHTKQSMAGVQDLPLQLPMTYSPRDAACNLLMLLGASVLVFSVVGEPPSIHAALAGFLLWVVGVARLLLGGQIGHYPRALAAASVEELAMGKPKQFIFRPSEPRPGACFTVIPGARHEGTNATPT